MDYKQIQELIKIVNKSNIGELTIEQKDFKISIKQKKEQTVQQVVAAPPVYQQSLMQQPQLQVTQPAGITQAENSAAEAVAKQDNLITIKSPMIGTFYKRSAPDKPAFIEIGDEITPGKVVCIIEAMKLFNEIESEISGKVVKILVDDSSPVEYDQPLILVEPN